MVDERFELLSLVFRLAESPGYCENVTDYQQKLSTVFSPYKNHDAVVFASKLPLGYDAVFLFAMHITKESRGFAFISDVSSLICDGRWTQETIADFLPLLNDFYIKSAFEQFFGEHKRFYDDESEQFANRVCSHTNFEWFHPYNDPGNLRVILTLSSSSQNNSATVNNAIAYAAVCPNVSARTLIHEFCHSFANPQALAWYAEDEGFREKCDNSVDKERWPMYGTGEVMAREYVTRAYETLYMIDNTGVPLHFMLAWHRGLGFRYIEDVFIMIAPDIKTSADDAIYAVLGVPYVMGEENASVNESRTLTWRSIVLSEPLPYEFHPSVTYCDGIINSKMGDIMYVNNAYLRFDVGEAKLEANKGLRVYYQLLL